MAEICPKKIVKPVSTQRGAAKPEIIPLLPSSNTAKLQRIIFDVRDHVLLRLLVCKEEITKNETSGCPYPEHTNNAATIKACGYSNKRLAHVYVRHEQTNEDVRSCVIVFIEGMRLCRTNELMDMLKNTVDWLEIAKEKPFFYIVRYGQAAINNTIDETRTTLTKKIKEIYKGYPDDDDTCIVLSVLHDSQSLMIDQTKKSIIKVKVS